VAILKDGTKFATSSYDGTAIIWEMQSKDVLLILTGHTKGINNLMGLSDGRLVTASEDHSIKVWNTINGMCERTLIGHGKAVYALMELPNLIIVSGSLDESIRVWDLSRSDVEYCVRVLKPADQYECEAMTLLDEQQMACASGENINVYKVEEGLMIKKIIGHSSRVSDLYLMPDKVTLISSSWDCTIKVWDWNERLCLRTLVGHTNYINKIVMANAEVLVSASSDGCVKFWRLESGKCVKTLKEHKGDIKDMKRFAKDLMVTCGEEKNVIFWKLE